MTTVSGGIFNFIDDSYTFPTASGGTYNFSGNITYDLTFELHATLPIIKSIFSVATYTYAATESGIIIFNNNVETDYYFKQIPTYSINTLWGNNETLYVGSTTGLLAIDYDDLHSNYAESVFTPSFQTASANVTYIHGKNKRLLLCTLSGMEYIDYTNNPIIYSRNYTNNTTKGFLTENKAYYISYDTVSGISTYTISRYDDLLHDWETPSLAYVTGSGILQQNIYVTDIFVTEGTAANNENTLFCTTSQGVYVIDESLQEYKIYCSQI